MANAVNKPFMAVVFIFYAMILDFGLFQGFEVNEKLYGENTKCCWQGIF